MGQFTGSDDVKPVNHAAIPRAYPRFHIDCGVYRRWCLGADPHAFDRAVARNSAQSYFTAKSRKPPGPDEPVGQRGGTDDGGA